jgi:hypothetical protein
MYRASSRLAAIAFMALAGILAAGCGANGKASSASTARTADVVATSSASSPSQWADHASAICENALSDDSHELVNHLDARHIKQHGMAIVAAGSRLDALGVPSGGDAHAYAHMIQLYKKSAIYHGLALRDLGQGNDGNAAAHYAIALGLADTADGLAVGFGAASCDRFGMEG